jgi:hypothetical protein
MAKLKDKPDALSSHRRIRTMPVVTIEPAEPWKLPTPPPGNKWHYKNDSEWREDMLPPGYRPMLDGELLEECDEWNNHDGYPSNKWESAATLKYLIGKPIDDSRVPFRTKRPLPGAAWKMPEPPKGKEWHCDNFAEEDLPPGYRPLLMDEKPQEGDEVKMGGKGFNEWIEQTECQREVEAARDSAPQRTRRPLPSPAIHGLTPIAPTLPPPPPGQAWHKDPWERDGAKHEHGWRPLLLNEIIDNDDEYWHAGKGPWTPVKGRIDVGKKADEHRVPFRTKRLLPTPTTPPPVATGIPTPRMEAALETEYPGKGIKSLINPRLQRLLTTAANIERELVIALDENAHQMCRANHWKTAHDIQARSRTAAEAELVTVRKELEELKAKVIEHRTMLEDDFTSGVDCDVVMDSMLALCGSSVSKVKAEAKRRNKANAAKP